MRFRRDGDHRMAVEEPLEERRSRTRTAHDEDERIHGSSLREAQVPCKPSHELLLTFRHHLYASVQLLSERLSQPRSLFQALRRRARKNAGVTKFIEKLAGSSFKALNVFRGHLGPPIPQARSDGEPSLFGVQAGLIPRASLVEAEHGRIVRKAEKFAQSGTCVILTGNQILVAHLVV